MMIRQNFQWCAVGGKIWDPMPLGVLTALLEHIRAPQTTLAASSPWIAPPSYSYGYLPLLTALCKGPSGSKHRAPSLLRDGGNGGSYSSFPCCVIYRQTGNVKGLLDDENNSRKRGVGLRSKPKIAMEVDYQLKWSEVQ